MLLRVSLYAKEKDGELVKKLMINYTTIPFVNDELEVIGIVSAYDVLDVLTERERSTSRVQNPA